MTNEFRSDALTDWAIRPWVHLTLRANFVQRLQFNLFVKCSHFISAIAFVSCHICFNWNLAQVNMLVAEWIDTYGIHHRRIFGSSYRKLAWVGLEPTTTEFCCGIDKNMYILHGDHTNFSSKFQDRIFCFSFWYIL